MSKDKIEKEVKNRYIVAKKWDNKDLWTNIGKT